MTPVLRLRAAILRLRAAIDRVLPSKLPHACLLLVAACASDPAEPICTAHALRVASVEIPRTNARARELAFDLDHDDIADNAAGLAASTVHGYAPIFDPSVVASARLATVPWTLGVQHCDDGTATVVDARMPVSLLVDAAGTFADAGFVPATHSAITLARDPDGTWRGKLGMAFEHTAMIEAVIGPLAPFFDEHGLFLDYFDAEPKDGRITVDELRQSNILRFLLLAPDVDKTGTSFAIGFTARE